MPRYFIKIGGRQFEEVIEDEYLFHAREARLNDFFHAIPNIGPAGRYIYLSVIGKICETHEQVEALLSGQKVE